MGQSVSYRSLLLPSLAGLICYACSQTPETVAPNLSGTAASPTALTEPSDQMAAQTAQAQDAAVSLAPAPAAPISAYREGINLASSAYQLSESAISPDDWQLVASRWQRAADWLKQVEASDQTYQIAQVKIADYIRQADYASAQIRALQASAIATPKISRASMTVPNAALNTAPSREKLAAPLPSALSPDAASPSVPLERVVVPIVRRLHGTPIVRVSFNSAKTYDMILDTGASRTLITRAMADELGIVTTERMVAATASESEVVFELGQVDSISMGGIALTNARVSIGAAVGIGLLGNDFLKGYDVTIRGRENVVELVKAH